VLLLLTRLGEYSMFNRILNDCGPVRGAIDSALKSSRSCNVDMFPCSAGETKYMYRYVYPNAALLILSRSISRIPALMDGYTLSLIPPSKKIYCLWYRIMCNILYPISLAAEEFSVYNIPYPGRRKNRGSG
jgi:hypothetical protein